MHLIFSEETDFSVNRVVDWLIYYNQTYKKYIGVPKSKEHYSFNDKKMTIKLGLNNANNTMNKELNPNSSTWFRRPNKRIDAFLTNYNYSGVTYPKEKLDDTIKNRFRIYWDFIGYQFSEQHHFGSFQTTELNKPIVLNEAQKLGLKIPKTLITNSKEDLLSFFKMCNKKIITKSLHEVIRDHRYEFKKDEYVFFYQMTKLIEHFEKDAPTVFAPSLFQEYIEKIYEIRTIFINGTCYSTCIFSQLNAQTKVDMRNREANHPTRYMPYQLPKEIEEKVTQLMNVLKLNFGAIDIMKSKKGDYYFVEINPVGQYGDVSIYGNYYLHKKIAEYLINDEKVTKK